MTTQKVYVDIMQTYDFNTELGKVGIIGFHTPNATTLNAVASGLMKNFKKVYFRSMDFAIGCISQLPVDPLGVGFEPGKIAPQDVVNPILFKACTGESLNVLLNVIYADPTGISQTSSLNTIDKFDVSNAEQAYYRLMNDPTFRTAHPQRGMVVNGLVPMVRQMLMNRPIQGESLNGNFQAIDGSGDFIASFASGITDADALSSVVTTDVQVMNGPLVHLPAQDTYKIPSYNGTENTHAQMVRAFCGVMVLPPAIQNSLYFRLNVVWHVCFESFSPSYESDNNITNQNTYIDWFVRPVDGATAQAMNMMTESVDVLDAVGIENIQNRSTSVN